MPIIFCTCSRLCSCPRATENERAFYEEEDRRWRTRSMLGIRKNTREEKLHVKRHKRLQFPTQIGVSPPYKLIESLREIVAGAWSEDRNRQQKAASKIKELLSADNPPQLMDQLIKSGVVKRLVSFLKKNHHDPQLQINAAGALGRIALGNTQIVVDHNAVPILVRLFDSSSDDDVRVEVIRALGNIAGNSYEHRDLVLIHNAMAVLLTCFGKDAQISMLRPMASALAHFRGGEPRLEYEQIKPAIGALKRLVLIDPNDEKVLTEALTALHVLSNATIGKIQPFIEDVIGAGIFELLISVLQKTNFGFEVKEAALRVISKVVAGGTNEQISNLADKPGCIQALCDLLLSCVPRIVILCLEVLDNILKNGEVEKNSVGAGYINIYVQKLEETGGMKMIKNFKDKEIHEKAVKIHGMYWPKNKSPPSSNSH